MAEMLDLFQMVVLDGDLDGMDIPDTLTEIKALAKRALLVGMETGLCIE